MLTERQKKILEIINDLEPVKGEVIAKELNLTRSALRTDFTILKNTGYIEAKHRIGYVVSKKDIHHMNSSVLVGEIMSSPLSLNENTTVYDAIMFMFEKDIGTLFLTKSEEISGVVSRKDLLKTSLGGADLTKLPLFTIMTRMPKIVSVSKADTAIYAAEKLIENEIDSLPVIEDNKIVGRITKTNITKLFINQLN